MSRLATATVPGRVDALDEAIDLLRPHVPGPAVDRAAKVVSRARARLGHGTDHTVVAVAGQTGSGKSSLVNALVGEDVCPVGVVRPTTDHARAVVFGDDAAAESLLDWLHVRHRHVVADRPELDGLVLLDLPDVDSVEAAHHLRARRLIDVVDMLVVVTDPQKYADQLLHEQVLAPLAGHRHVLEVVLSQVDRLDPEGRQTCLADLRRRLEQDGIAGLAPRATSAVTGEGVDELRDLLARVVEGRRATLDRVAADLARAAEDLIPPGSPTPRDDALPRSARRTAVDGLAAAIGADAVADVVAAQHRRDAGRALGWPPVRWVARWRRSPVDALPDLRRSPITASQVRAVLRDVGEDAGAEFGAPWDHVVRDAARDQQEPVVDGLHGVSTRDVEALLVRPRWWRAVAVLHRVLLWAVGLGAVAVIGLLVAQAFLLIDLGDSVPRWRGVPLPTLVLLGGLVGGWVLSLVARLVVVATSGRRRGRARRRLRAAVAEVVDDRLASPVTAALTDLHEARRQLQVAAGPRDRR